MTGGEALYLVLVIVAMTGFAASLALVTWTTNRKR